MQVVPYEEKYREAVRKICIDTGSPDNKVNPQHRAFTLLMYCDPYLDHGTAFVLLDDDNTPQGYILCAENIQQFAKDFEPYKEKIMKECPDFKNRADLSTYEKYGKNYPAHLHIDIEEICTGHGSGTALMHTLINHLKQVHCRGLMVGVDTNNKRAFSFYKKTGFRILNEQDGGAAMGMELQN